ncbi:MAG: hypothetical protein M1818_001690 [Claussenomyces sp. TS43310]|nr:MAG: hypothetical protein M1818_001690 [Claussenomyces sp. TS43310]
MPFDTVKTRMQSLRAKSEYRNTPDCVAKILRHEGVAAFWSGSTARLGRLIFSGGIVFTIYEAVIDLLRPL